MNQGTSRICHYAEAMIYFTIANKLNLHHSAFKETNKIYLYISAICDIESEN